MGCAGGGGTEQIGLLLLMFAVLYFLMIRPQQKIEVADRTRIRVLRSHIAGLDEPPTEKS
jgi:preprotein translocase subunit YajC